jgi:hypothetical protein
MRRVTIWGVIAAVWVSWCVGALLVAICWGDWHAIVPIILILGITMPNYAKHARRRRAEAERPIIE